ncbi:MAG: hypothetical protein HC868_00210 [Sphingomonadales bacterium]|nr:hypothetical protein [Sphingomonadales bacterium]
MLISIDETRDLNNGQPSLWARLFDALDIAPGERVLQVGAGTGYYSAILAYLVGNVGRVIAVEHDRDLADKAKASLSGWPQAEVIAGDGTAHDAGEVDVIIVCGSHASSASLAGSADRQWATVASADRRKGSRYPSEGHAARRDI